MVVFSDVKQANFSFCGNEVVQASVVTAVVYLDDVLSGAYMPGVYDARFFSFAGYFRDGVHRFSTAINSCVSVMSTIIVVITRRPNRRLVSGCFVFIVRVR